MGKENRSIVQRLTAENVPPRHDQIEVTLTGPGYGECVLIHIGNGDWAIIDSCLDEQKFPAALSYLNCLGVDPAKEVRIIIATHWHDDHIRGMGDLVEICTEANFWCSAALCEEEFVAMIGTVSKRPMTRMKSGMQELYKIFTLLYERSSQPNSAIANRRIYNRNNCEIWSLSPSDSEFDSFRRNVGLLLSKEGEPKRNILTLTPNQVAVVLLIMINETAILLGSDLERPGWLQILDSAERPNNKASVFKIPHHGSKNAHVDRVWNEMLNKTPTALLTPWRLCGRELPTKADISRILSLADKSYITSARQSIITKSKRDRDRSVERTIRESGAKLRYLNSSPGKIRLRKIVGFHNEWNVEMFGMACDLKNYY